MNFNTNSPQPFPKAAAQSDALPSESQQAQPSFKKLTAHELRNLYFHNDNSRRFSWSPKAAFDEREGKALNPDSFETLHDYLTRPAYQGVAEGVLLEVHPSRLPRTNALMTIYRVADRDCGSGYRAILPGASVSESRTYVERHASLYMNNGFILMSTKVFPDELLTCGDPHEFLYIPRSLQLGFERYAADVEVALQANYQ